MTTEQEEAAGAGRGDWLWLAMIAAAVFAVALPLSSYPSALPIIREEWGISDTEAGLINGITAAGSVIGALVLIPLTDKWRADHVLLGSALTTAIGHLLFPLVAENLASAAPLRLAAGLGLAGVYVTGTRIVAERFPTSVRARAVGIYVTCFYLGTAASFAITGALIPLLEWRGAYTAAAAGSFLTLAIYAFALRGYKPIAAPAAAGRIDLTVLKDKNVAVVILSYLLHSVELIHVRTWLAPFLAFILVTQGGIAGEAAAAEAAVIVGIAGLLGALAPFLGGLLSDRIGRLPSAMLLFFISGVCSLAIGWTVELPWAAVLTLAFIYSIAVGADSAIYSSAITEVAEPARLGSTLGVHAFGAFGAGVISPVMFGAVLDLVGREHTAAWGLAFGTAGVGAAVAIVAMAWLRTQAGATRRPIA